MDLIVVSPNLALWNGKSLRCAIGSGGFNSPENRKDGDHTTPIGRWPMREVYYREDKGARPQTVLPLKVIRENDGWCDDAADPNYNRFVVHPYPASAEKLCREDDLYDIVVVLGYNDKPVIPGKGSAIFLHIARPRFTPSEGCVHLSREDLEMVLREGDNNSAVVVAPELRL